MLDEVYDGRLSKPKKAAAPMFNFGGGGSAFKDLMKSEMTHGSTTECKYLNGDEY